MNNEQLVNQISTALDKHRIAAFATVEGNQPKARYMAIFHDRLIVYLATNRKTHKVEEIKDNPNAYLLLGYDGKQPHEVIEMQGSVVISQDDSLREKLWTDEFKEWFNGPSDPDYVVLQFTPARIEYTAQGNERQVWERGE